MNKHYPLVSIITVNFNQPRYTEALLASLQKISYPNWEVVVVENGCSPEGQAQTASYARTKTVVSDVNLGFAGGNNLGIRHSQGEYILLLNNDTEVAPDFLEPLVEVLESIEKVGIVSPLLIFQESGKVQYAGARAINPFTGRGKKIGHLGDVKDYRKTYPTELGHGAAMIFRRSLLAEVGYLHEDFFLYYEEHDWTEAVKRAGYQVYFQGLSQVYHKESASVGKMSPLKTHYINRSRVLYILRNTQGFSRLSSLAIFYGLALPKKILQHLLRAEFDHVRSLLTASRIIFSPTHEHSSVKNKPLPC